jgi:hypothetical protein
MESVIVVSCLSSFPLFRKLNTFRNILYMFPVTIWNTWDAESNMLWFWFPIYGWCNKSCKTSAFCPSEIKPYALLEEYNVFPLDRFLPKNPHLLLRSKSGNFLTVQWRLSRTALESKVLSSHLFLELINILQERMFKIRCQNRDIHTCLKIAFRPWCKKVYKDVSMNS